MMSFLDWIPTLIMVWVALSVVMTSTTWVTAKLLKSVFPGWWQRHIAVEVYDSDY